MKKILFLAALGWAGMFIYNKIKKRTPVQPAQEKVSNSAVDYTQALQRSVDKAQQAQEKANLRVQESVSEAEKTIDAMEK